MLKHLKNANFTHPAPQLRHMVLRLNPKTIQQWQAIQNRKSVKFETNFRAYHSINRGSYTLNIPQLQQNLRYGMDIFKAPQNPS